MDQWGSCLVARRRRVRSPGPRGQGEAAVAHAGPPAEGVLRTGVDIIRLRGANGVNLDQWRSPLLPVQWIELRKEGAQEMDKPAVWPIPVAIILIIAIGRLVQMFLQALQVIG